MRFPLQWMEASAVCHERATAAILRGFTHGLSDLDETAGPLGQTFYASAWTSIPTFEGR